MFVLLGRVVEPHRINKVSVVSVQIATVMMVHRLRTRRPIRLPKLPTFYRHAQCHRNRERETVLYLYCKTILLECVTNAIMKQTDSGNFRLFFWVLSCAS